jgi:bifunctional non-homologous end joining protein LigD
LQGHGQKPAHLVFFAFDLLHLDGADLVDLPLLDRKDRLEALLRRAAAAIRFSRHAIGDGEAIRAGRTLLGGERGTPSGHDGSRRERYS